MKIYCFLVAIFFFSSTLSNPLKAIIDSNQTHIDPKTFICYDEYDCNCGIVQVEVNGKECQLCGCGYQYEKIKFFILNTLFILFVRQLLIDTNMNWIIMGPQVPLSI
ncbi:hypothetical protein BpHYR1_021526 [Brachionus plicatilis]|uniref:Uncharacterized protein n=1 Tax=Brachionus plicatilis TaxID=10195 RepID=A0A3M7SFP5_BRAPC|nr:hypothetical protein BpHYR1_021526 [Brachionus plicatilis]